VAGSMVSTSPLKTTVLTMSSGVAANTSRTVRTATWAMTPLYRRSASARGLAAGYDVIITLREDAA
jgi:hypothetical protein